MSVFIEIVTDSFQDNFARKSADGQAARRAGASSVRRPLRGLEIKDDTYAILKVIQADGTELPLIDSGGTDGASTAYANFILQSVQEARMEKHQIVETFGESYIFFFGEAPRFLDVTAVLVNSNDFNWEAEWWANYDLYLRGSKSVELGARTYIFYDDTIVEGYMLQAQSMKMSDQPLMVQLSFRLFLTNYQNISFVGNPTFPTRASLTIPSDLGFNPLTDTLNPDQLNQFVGNAVGLDSNGNQLGGYDLNRLTPLRSAITDNFDEWTGSPPTLGPDPFSALEDQVQQDIQDAQDTLQALIDQVASFGVDVNSPAFMLAMGLGPNFTQGQGVGIGAGAGFSASASFSASVSIDFSASISFGTQSSVDPGADLEAQELNEVIQQQVLESQAQIQLDANGGSVVFTAFDQPTFSAGVSFSASISLGTVPTSSDPAHFNLSAGATFAGGAGSNASQSVGGTSTAFAMASFEGDLDPTGSSSSIASVSFGF